MNFREETYRTPPGMTDYPFAYVFDATGLTNAQNYMDLQLPLQGDSEFILRHIAGVPLCIAAAADGGRFNYKNASRSYTTSAIATGIVMPDNFTVVPEKLYPFNASIYLDLFDVLRDNTGVSPAFNSYIAFFGAK